MTLPCIHLRPPTGRTVTCKTCAGRVELKVYACVVHQRCTIGKSSDGLACCATCKDRVSTDMQSVLNAVVTKEPAETLVVNGQWSYGVTTVPKRRGQLLPKTLESLMAAGFDNPRLFVDGDDNTRSWSAEFGLEVTGRSPAVRTHGNWALALHELFIREPNASRYAIFQDDLVASANLKTYLDSCEYPKDGYWNLYTFPDNQRLAPQVGQTGRQAIGWYKSNGRGLGALALVFDREAALAMMSSRHMAERPMSATRGHKYVDGGIVDAMRKAGRREYVHNPSLVQHTGDVSTIGNFRHPQAVSFRGERFSALDLVEEKKHN